MEGSHRDPAVILNLDRFCTLETPARSPDGKTMISLLCLALLWQEPSSCNNSLLIEALTLSRGLLATAAPTPAPTPIFNTPKPLATPPGPAWIPAARPMPSRVRSLSDLEMSTLQNFCNGGRFVRSDFEECVRYAGSIPAIVLEHHGEPYLRYAEGRNNVACWGPREQAPLLSVVRHITTPRRMPSRAAPQRITAAERLQQIYRVCGIPELNWAKAND